MREVIASVGRFVKGLFGSGDTAGPKPEVSDELKMEQERRRGMRGD